MKMKIQRTQSMLPLNYKAKVIDPELEELTGKKMKWRKES
jgi:hypothetical protein